MSCCLHLSFWKEAKHHLNFSQNLLSLSRRVFKGFSSFFYICLRTSHFSSYLFSFSLSLSPASAVSPGLEMNAEQAEAAGVTVAKACVILFSSQLPSNDV